MTFLLTLVITFSVWAEEADEFITDRGRLGRSATPELNKLINDSLKGFENKFNGGGFSCDRKEMVFQAKYYFDENFSSIGNKLRDMSDASGQRPRGPEPKRQNNYGKRRVPEAQPTYNLRFFGASVEDESIYKGTDTPCCVRLLNVGGTAVGLDKIDHFFGNGGLLWEEYEKQKESGASEDLMDKVLEANTAQEHSGWGLADAGVKSYGDLAANWSGFGFYRELFDGQNPYFKCANGKVTLNRSFKLEDYFKKSWSEAINCSAFDSAARARGVFANLRAKGMNCPMIPAACEEIKRMYTGKELQHLVSPVCRGEVTYDKSVEKASSIDWTNVFGGVRARDARRRLFGAPRQADDPVEPDDEKEEESTR